MSSLGPGGPKRHGHRHYPPSASGPQNSVRHGGARRSTPGPRPASAAASLHRGKAEPTSPHRQPNTKGQREAQKPRSRPVSALGGGPRGLPPSSPTKKRHSSPAEEALPPSPPPPGSRSRLPSLALTGSTDYQSSLPSSAHSSRCFTPKGRPGSGVGRSAMMGSTPTQTAGRPLVPEGGRITKMDTLRPCLLATPVHYEAKLKEEFEGSPSATLRGNLSLTQPLDEISSRDLLYCSEGSDPIRSAEKLKMQLSLNSPERNPPSKPPTCLPGAGEKSTVARLNPSFYHHGW